MKVGILTCTVSTKQVLYIMGHACYAQIHAAWCGNDYIHTNKSVCSHLRIA